MKSERTQTILCLVIGIAIIGIASLANYWSKNSPAAINARDEQASRDFIADANAQTARDASRKRRAAAAKRELEIAKAAAPKIESALTRLEGDGVTRNDVKRFFYEEIEEEVCDQRKCDDD